MDLSKLLDGFVKVDVWISLSCNMDLSKLIQGFIEFFTFIGKSERRKIYYVLNVLQLKSNHKSLNAIYFWGQEVNIWAAAGDHRGVASH